MKKFLFVVLSTFIGGVLLFYWQNISFMEFTRSTWSSCWAWLSEERRYSNGTVLIQITAAVIIAAVIVGALCFWLKSTSAPTPVRAPPVPRPDPLSAIDDIDRHIIRCLVSFDGEWADISDVSVRVGRQKLVTTRSLEKLVALGLASDTHAANQESWYKLNSRGTTYAIDNNLTNASL